MVIRRYQTLLWILALALGLTVASASHVGTARAQSAGLSITTDQSQYRIGDAIKLCYTVPAPGPVVITDIDAAGNTQVVISGQDDGTGGCLSGSITGPTGTECLRIDFTGASSPSSARACFQVISASSGGTTPSSGFPCADPSNNCTNCGQATYAGEVGNPCSTHPASGPCADPANNCNQPPQPTPPGPLGPHGTTTGGQNSCGGQGSPSISVQPTAARIGATVTVRGYCFTANGSGGLIYLDLVSPDGSQVDTAIAPIACQITNNPIYTVVCSSGSTGPQIVSNDADGSFVAPITIPAQARPGAQQLCAQSVFFGMVCTPFTVQG